jgi:hypothetical protein
MQDLDKIRSELATYTQAITLVLNLIGLSSQGKVERYMENHGDELREIKASLNWVTAKFQVREGSIHRKRSILSSYMGDNKEVWKMFKRELIHDGFSSRVLGRHKEIIKDYVMELGARGVIDDVVPGQVSKDRATESASRNRVILYREGVSIPVIRRVERAVVSGASQMEDRERSSNNSAVAIRGNSGQFRRRSAASTSSSQNQSATRVIKHHHTPPVWPNQASIERPPTSNSTSYTNGNGRLSQPTSSALRAPNSSIYPWRTLKSVYGGELIQTRYEKPVNNWGPLQITPMQEPVNNWGPLQISPHGKKIITAQWESLQTVRFDLSQPPGTEDNLAGATVCWN